MLSTRSSWTSTSIPQNVGWQFIGHIVLMRRLSLIDSPSAMTTIGRPVLAWRRNPSHDARTVAAARRRPENDHLSLVGDDADQRLDCKSMGHEHERSRPAPGGDDLLQLAKSSAVGRVAVGHERPRALDGADGHQRGRVHTAAHRRGEDPVHAHAVLPESLAQRLALRAPLVVEVPLRLAVVEPEARWIAAVPGRRVAVANQRDVTAAGPRGPRLLLVRGDCRSDGQQHGDNGKREPTEPARHQHHQAINYELERGRSAREAIKTLAGVSGSAVIERSAGERASHTAFAMAPPRPGLPHSPRPRRPSGLVVARTSW